MPAARNSLHRENHMLAARNDFSFPILKSINDHFSHHHVINISFMRLISYVRIDSCSIFNYEISITSDMFPIWIFKITTIDLQIQNQPRERYVAHFLFAYRPIIDFSHTKSASWALCSSFSILKIDH